MTAYFDDGSDAVPGDVVRPVRRVLVMGAGIAGLTVANALSHAGVECVVLEARDRVGGRLHTVDLGGSPVDLGGSWLHHPSGNPLSRFADLAGIERVPGDPMSSLAALDLPTGSWLTREEVERELTGDLGGFVSALAGLREDLGPTASAADGIEEFVTTRRLRGPELRRARQGLRANVEADAAGAAEQQSLEWLWTQDEYDDTYFGDLPRPGFGAIAQAMAAELDVRTRWRASHVEVTDEQVSVIDDSGRAETGSHLVVAVPLGVLKSGSLTFSPPLPLDRAQTVARLGFGRYEKVILRFPSPFWREAGWSHLVLFPSAPDDPATWIFDLDAFGAGPILACHVFHSATRHLAAAPAEMVRWATDQIAVALGAPCPEPIAVAVTSWADDPHARGAYTHVTVGASNADLDSLGTPVAGRLLFAGEHTQSARVGYADGAMTSGIREAKRLLGVPEVLLGPSS